MNQPASLSPARHATFAGPAGLATVLLAVVACGATAAMLFAQLSPPAPAAAEQETDVVPDPPVLPPAAEFAVPDAARVFAAHAGADEADAPTF